MSHEVLTCVCREIAEAKAGDPELQCPTPKADVLAQRTPDLPLDELAELLESLR